MRKMGKGKGKKKHSKALDLAMGKFKEAKRMSRKGGRK